MTPHSINDILESLGLPKDQRRQIIAEADVAARRVKKQRPLRLPFLLLMMLVFSGCPISIALNATATWTSPIRIVIVVFILVAMIFLGWKWHQRVWSAYLRPHIVESLGSRGYRVCVFCGYVLRGVPSETEYCPECATGITSRPERLLAAGIRISDNPGDLAHGTRLVKGIELTPAQWEDALISVKGLIPEMRWWIRWSLWVWAVVVALSSFGVMEPWLRATWPGISRPMRAELTIGVAITIYVFPMFLFVFLRIRSLPRRARRALRSAGYEICERCGQFLGNLTSSEIRCPTCRSKKHRFIHVGIARTASPKKGDGS